MDIEPFGWFIGIGYVKNRVVQYVKKEQTPSIFIVGFRVADRIYTILTSK
jgi:hypothetical protein